MTPSEPDSTAVLAVKIDNLTGIVEHLREDLKAQSATYVRHEVYSTKMLALDREIAGIKKDAERAESRRPTGLAISALGVSILVAIVTIIQAIVK